ncbi:hypothetical protein ABZT51_46575, partial [Streptomyces sp. NPDC005373]
MTITPITPTAAPDTGVAALPRARITELLHLAGLRPASLAEIDGAAALQHRVQRQLRVLEGEEARGAGDPVEAVAVDVDLAEE